MDSPIVLDEEGSNTEENLEDKINPEIKLIADQMFNDTSGPDFLNLPADSNLDRTWQEEEREEVTPVTLRLRPTIVETPSESGSASLDEGNTDSSSGGENFGRWTAKEHSLFLAAIRQYGRKWTKISKMLQTRTRVQVRTHAIKYYAKLAKARKNDKKLMVEMEANYSYNTFNVRAGSNRACQNNDRTKKALVQNSGRWKAEEHRLFLTAVCEHGRNWDKIAAFIETRTPTQVRTHAQKYYSRLSKEIQDGEANALYSVEKVAMATALEPLSVGKHKTNNAPSINTGRWTAEEHQLFLSFVAKHGENGISWKKISEDMKTRTAVQVRTHAQSCHSMLSNEMHDGETNVLGS
mmetsp:Transcript_28030/g.58432  ORF Transcript_28030/g.58432 Transcript_28030/m.58432 type:complete len:351 (+) Transcript_28030:114-1166(+)